MKQTLTVTQRQNGITLKEYLTQQGYFTTQVKRFNYGSEILVIGKPVTEHCVLKARQVIYKSSSCVIQEELFLFYF